LVAINELSGAMRRFNRLELKYLLSREGANARQHELQAYLRRVWFGGDDS
jgi:hypothetical protein